MSECRHVDVEFGRTAISVLAVTPAIAIDADAKRIDPCVCDDNIVGLWVAPTVTYLNCVVTDYRAGMSGACARLSMSEGETDGAPCRAWWRLVNPDAPEYATIDFKNKGVEGHTHEATTMDTNPVYAAQQRDVTYDLWWRYTSGSVVSDWILVVEGFVYVPPEGDGNGGHIYPFAP